MKLCRCKTNRILGMVTVRYCGRSFTITIDRWLRMLMVMAIDNNNQRKGN